MSEIPDRGWVVAHTFENLKPLRPPADEGLQELVAERYEPAATIVTSNLDLPDWDQAFPANKLLASATLDRLRHNAYCLCLTATTPDPQDNFPLQSDNCDRTAEHICVPPGQFRGRPVRNNRGRSERPAIATSCRLQSSFLEGGYAIA